MKTEPFTLVNQIRRKSQPYDGSTVRHLPFFRDNQESIPLLLPSWVGTCIMCVWVLELSI